MKTRLILALCFCLPLAAQSRIVYTKSFPGSTPAFVEITIERDGKAVYKEAVDDDRPIKFQIKQQQADEIFALAEKLERFKKPLESGLKVANMGMKTFRWVEGTAKLGETSFNYSLDTDAHALHEWFEKMTESENHFISLEHTARYDKLGVNRALLLFNASVDRGRVLALEQFLPLLDRISKNDSYLNMDRERAGNLATAIRSPEAKPAAAQ